MIDAETSELHEELTSGQRHHDLDIMVVNIAGGMADIAAERGLDIDDADLRLGEDIVQRYEALWRELTDEVVIRPDEGYRVKERVERLNALGFEVEDLDLGPHDEAGERRLRLRVTVGGRNFHSTRLRELTGIDAAEQQARQILSDLQYFEATRSNASSTGKSVLAIRWRVEVFEALMQRIAEELGDARETVQAYCDFLHYRYLLATEQHRDVPNDEAFESWVAAGFPGYDPEGPPVDELV